MLLNTGFINQNDFIETSNSANEIRLGSYKYSWLINILYDERTLIITIIYHIKKFETKKYDFNLIDLLGDIHLRKNMMKVLSLADAKILL